MSGNFDYPPANSSTADDLNQFPARFQHLRQVLNQNRDRDRPPWAVTAEARTSQSASPMPPLTRSATRRRRTSTRSPPRLPNEQSSRLSDPPAQTPNYATLRDRPRAVPGERYLRRRRAMNEIRNTASTASTARSDLQDGTRRLEQMNSSLSDLLEPPERLYPPMTFPYSSDLHRADNHREPPRELDRLRRSLKRRKLDHNDDCAAFEGIRYGREGQVDPGRLKMEVVACDGGSYRGTDSANNILLDNDDVYCTKSSQCNLLIRHQGEATFALDKIVIKAPKRGYTHPIQEGLIFIGMTSEELSNIQEYSIQYTDPYPRTSESPEPQPYSSSRRHSRYNEELSLLESLTDPDIFEHLHERRLRREAAATSSRQNSDEASRTLARLRYGHTQDNESLLDADNDVCDWPSLADGRVDGQASPTDYTAPTPPPFTVTAESDDDDSSHDDDIPRPPRHVTGRLRQRLAAARALRQGGESSALIDDDDGELPSLGIYNAYGPGADYLGRGPFRGPRRGTPSRIEPRGSDEYGDDGDREGSEERRRPHARFFISREKSAIHVKFEPAVSGKFILLKLYSPWSGGNIDIKNVSAYGYSGPRMFPAIEPR
ncbi:hypothetical protein K402DRAFT_425076 [Aulographum hederae CBS 113979]|uniref:Uncharacterized protein n=1 Tax=Aulographum hederae CBS 113979 TaxID=1176131 RepID=A0A6G1GLZ1_9PEZI|nr:hypothetical protein K402DRAFT_425076 [Aulographum hederae CBS 113979]